MADYKIEIVEYASDVVIKTMTASNERTANRTEDGLNINLDHEKYYTRIVHPQEQSK